MIYFLDFDRTLFDTDAFNETLPDEPGCAPFVDELHAVLAAGRDETLTGGNARLAAWQKVQDAIASGSLSFPPGKLAQFLYKDVPEFLRALGNEAIVITYGGETFQRAKVESALADIVRVTALYTGHTPKAEYLSTWPGYYGAPAVFVDDRTAELEAFAARFPAMQLFRMERAHAKHDTPLAPSPGDSWKIIHSLTELP